MIFPNVRQQGGCEGTGVKLEAAPLIPCGSGLAAFSMVGEEWGTKQVFFLSGSRLLWTWWARWPIQACWLLTHMTRLRLFLLRTLLSPTYSKGGSQWPEEYTFHQGADEQKLGSWGRVLGRGEDLKGILTGHLTSYLCSPEISKYQGRWQRGR